MKKILLFPDASGGSTPPTPAPVAATSDTGDVIAVDIAAVGAVVSPIVALVGPEYSIPLNLAFKLLAILEPAAFKAVQAIVNKQALTPEQDAEIKRVDVALQNPDTYLLD
jgi:hypothetical protein